MKEFDPQKYLKKADHSQVYESEYFTRDYVTNVIRYPDSKINDADIEDDLLLESLSEEECDLINHVASLRSKEPILSLGDEYDRFLDSVNWRGYIEQIDMDTKMILGRISDVSSLGMDAIEEHVTFSFKDISTDDLELVKEGAIFYYSVGYAVNRGQRMKQQVIRFKRGAARSIAFDREMKEIEAKAVDLVSKILWE
jgi:hypothetical protein